MPSCGYRWGGSVSSIICFFFQAEDGIRDLTVTGVQTCALPIYERDVHHPKVIWTYEAVLTAPSRAGHVFCAAPFDSEFVRITASAEWEIVNCTRRLDPRQGRNCFEEPSVKVSLLPGICVRILR